LLIAFAAVGVYIRTRHSLTFGTSPIRGHTSHPIKVTASMTS
jgi:hypothetical protein